MNKNEINNKTNKLDTDDSGRYIFVYVVFFLKKSLVGWVCHRRKQKKKKWLTSFTLVIIHVDSLLAPDPFFLSSRFSVSIFGYIYFFYMT